MAKIAKIVKIAVDKSSLKMPKMANFDHLKHAVKQCSMQSNSVTRQVNLKRTKNMWKILGNFKQCDNI